LTATKDQTRDVVEAFYQVVQESGIADKKILNSLMSESAFGLGSTVQSKRKKIFVFEEFPQEIVKRPLVVDE
jgi:hypothetical protein